MAADLPRLLDAFAGLDVIVLGEAMLDVYLEGAAGRFCPEAPVPAITLTGRRDLPGGAANTAVNVRSLGARVSLLSVTGSDSEGGLLRTALEDRGVCTEHLLAQPGRRTLTKQRVVAASQLLLRLDQGSTELLESDPERLLIDRLTGLLPRCNALIISDYSYGVLTPGVLRAVADLLGRRPTVVVADSRRLGAFRDLAPTAVKPSYEEALALLGAAALPGVPDRAGGIAPHAEQLLDRTGARIVAVTLDRDGALILERGRPPHRTFAAPVRSASVSGAGDTFTAALALALAAGGSAAAAGELAAAAAAVVVAKERTAACSAAELRAQLGAGGKYVADRRRLAECVDAYRREGRRVVFTNGCFDILHRGHVTLLHRAKALGDVLVVGVNSDAGIRRLKGPGRPINTLEDRLQVLAALGCIDLLTSFDEDTPCELIRVLRPQVFVKGGDYSRERLPEAPLVEAQGGVVQILPHLEERSTTGIIAKIQRDSGPGHGGASPGSP
jgi:D-beta-D-heptose 7-phosphate kinase/D-beta-D-heptose 1-phosphate adenosyltransferase